MTPSHVVMVGTSFETRSEVGSVLHAYRDAGLFERWPVEYLESHREGSKLARCRDAAKSLLVFFGMVLREPRAVLHVHSCAGMSFWRKALFMALALAARWPVVFHLHGTGFATFYDARCGAVGRALVRFFLDRAACIVVVSPRWCAWMHRVSRNPKIVTIAPPVTIPPPSTTRDPMLVVDASAGGAPSAALEQAVAVLRGRFPAVRLERVADLGTRDRAEVFARAGTVVLADEAEGWPVRLLEAMASGVPVVASAVGGMVDLVDHGFNGLLVPPRDAAALVRSLAQLLESPALAREMGRAGRATMASRFAADRALEALDRIYSQLGVPRSRLAAGSAVARTVPVPATFTAARRLQEN
jgi:glycosyltransferase involved in cell wall biosynthesis